MNSAIVTLVLKMKVIAILMMSVKMVLVVDPTIAQLHLVLTLKVIVVINQLLEMNIFVHLEFLVVKMKEIVILMMSVKIIFFVDIKIVQSHLVMMMLIAVVEINSRVQIIQIIISIMMKKLGS